MASYGSYSPYFLTPNYRRGLDVMRHRTIPKMPDDIIYQIDAQFNNRPDLLAFDLYGTTRLWWIFAARNPSAIKDPIYDFRTGNIIYIPKKTTLEQTLGT